MGAGGSVALPEGDSVTLDEAKAYAGEGGWNEDAQKAFDAAAADGKVTKDAISAYEAEQNKAATKLQASIRGQQERKNPTKPPEKSGDAPALVHWSVAAPASSSSDTIDAYPFCAAT